MRPQPPLPAACLSPGELNRAAAPPAATIAAADASQQAAAMLAAADALGVPKKALATRASAKSEFLMGNGAFPQKYIGLDGPNVTCRQAGRGNHYNRGSLFGQN